LTSVQIRNHQLIYRADTPEGQLFVEDTRHILPTLRPFLQQWTRLPEDYDELCRQALIEVLQPDFVATWKFVTVWGTVTNND
jgi:hypothetical protein